MLSMLRRSWRIWRVQRALKFMMKEIGKTDDDVLKDAAARLSIAYVVWLEREYRDLFGAYDDIYQDEV